MSFGASNNGVLTKKSSLDAIFFKIMNAILQF